MQFENKLVAIINKELEQGVALNALGHMTLGLGAQMGKDILRLNDYQDANNNIYPNISQIPFIILRAKANEICKTVLSAREMNIAHGIFLDTMTGGTYVEQLERTTQSDEEKLVYYGCVLFGAWDDVSNITRKFSLWK